MNEAKERIGPPIREVVTWPQYLTKRTCLLLVALAGHPLLEMEDAGAQEPAIPAHQSSQPNEVKGTVSQYLMNPMASWTAFSCRTTLWCVFPHT
jgi:hypothetical protein